MRVVLQASMGGYVFVSPESVEQIILPFVCEPTDPRQIDIALYSLTAGSWLDPNTTTGRWRVNLLLTDVY
jgi:hypothetical protein